MGYCTIDDIKAEFKTLKFADSTDEGLTEAEATKFIDQASAMIDAQISNCFVLPIEDVPENAITLMNLTNVCTWFVADRLVPILQIKSRNQNVDQAGQDHITYYTKAKSLLNMICPAKTSGVEGPAKKDGSVEVDFSSDQENFFIRDVAQW